MSIKQKAKKKGVSFCSLLALWPEGQQEIAVWIFWDYSQSVGIVSSFLFLFLSAICQRMNRWLYSCVSVQIWQSKYVSMCTVSGGVYFGLCCFKRMVWISYNSEEYFER